MKPSSLSRREVGAIAPTSLSGSASQSNALVEMATASLKSLLTAAPFVEHKFLDPKIPIRWEMDSIERDLIFHEHLRYKRNGAGEAVRAFAKYTQLSATNVWLLRQCVASIGFTFTRLPDADDRSDHGTPILGALLDFIGFAGSKLGISFDSFDFGSLATTNIGQLIGSLLTPSKGGAINPLQAIKFARLAMGLKPALQSLAPILGDGVALFRTAPADRPIAFSNRESLCAMLCIIHALGGYNAVMRAVSDGPEICDGEGNPNWKFVEYYVDGQHLLSVVVSSLQLEGWQDSIDMIKELILLANQFFGQKPEVLQELNKQLNASI